MLDDQSPELYMFRRYFLYSFLCVTCWLLLVLSIGYIFPDRKLGPGFTISILVILTQLIMIVTSVVAVIIRLFMVRTMALGFGYTLIAMFNFGLGLIAVYWFVTGNLISLPFMFAFGFNLLCGLLMLIDAARQLKGRSSAMQNNIS